MVVVAEQAIIANHGRTMALGASRLVDHLEIAGIYRDVVLAGQERVAISRRGIIHFQRMAGKAALVVDQAQMGAVRKAVEFVNHPIRAGAQPVDQSGRLIIHAVTLGAITRRLGGRQQAEYGLHGGRIGGLFIGHGEIHPGTEEPVRMSARAVKKREGAIGGVPAAVADPVFGRGTFIRPGFGGIRGRHEFGFGNCLTLPISQDFRLQMGECRLESGVQRFGIQKGDAAFALMIGNGMAQAAFNPAG